MSKNNPNRADSYQPYCIVTPASVARAPRARQPTKNFSGLFRGKFPSLKMGRMVHWESLLERDAIMLFEFSPGVTSFREQPFSTHYFIDGKMRRYTPDFELTLQCGRVLLVEVKPWDKLQVVETLRRFKAIQSHFQSSGLSFLLLDDKHIRRQPLLKNLFTLCCYRTPPPSAEELRQFEEILNHVEPLTFGTAVQALGSERAFWQLVALEQITIELAAEIHINTPCRTTRKKSQNEKVYF
jgi:hypothetical protein